MPASRWQQFPLLLYFNCKIISFFYCLLLIIGFPHLALALNFPPCMKLATFLPSPPLFHDSLPPGSASNYKTFRNTFHFLFRSQRRQSNGGSKTSRWDRVREREELKWDWNRYSGPKIQLPCPCHNHFHYHLVIDDEVCPEEGETTRH